MKKYTFTKIGDKEYPIKFGFNSLRKYSAKTNTSLADLIDDDFDAIGRCMEVLAEQMAGNTEKKQKANKK